jgi:calpain-7
MYTTRKHFCFFEKRLEKGVYTLIPTTFEQGEKGTFCMTVSCPERAVQVERIKNEGEGMLCTQIADVWDIESAGGNPTSPTYLSNPRFRLKLDKSTTVK